MKIDWKKEISLPKPRKPSLPSRASKSKSSRPSLGGPDLRMPKLLTDLYADLRDRHLLPLVALLIVAIVAAPILLSDGGGEEEPAIAPTSVEGETKTAGLTVVPAEDGLRDYKRRLGHRAPLNPFRRPPGEEASGSGTSSSGSGAEAGSESLSTVESSSSVVEEVKTTTVGGVTTETSSPVSPASAERHHRKSHKSRQTESTGGESTESTPAEPTHTESSTDESSSPAATAAVVGFTIDAEAGFVPKASEKTGIEPMTKLPNKKHPLVLFLGLSQNHKRALFLMTSNVTAYYGGHCALDKQACQLVEVAPGKGVTFAAGYGNTRYKVHLKRIVPVVKRAH